MAFLKLECHMAFQINFEFIREDIPFLCLLYQYFQKFIYVSLINLSRYAILIMNEKLRITLRVLKTFNFVL